MKVNLIIKNYPKEAEKLVRIWENHNNSLNNGLDFITFINKRPKSAKNDNRKIAGLSARVISYLRDDEELVKMSVENFIYLMTKCGVDFEIAKEEKRSEL